MSTKIKNVLRQLVDKQSSFAQIKDQDQHYKTMSTVVEVYGDGNGAIAVHPEGEGQVPKDKYYNNDKLKAFVLPTDVKNIGVNAFALCDSFAKIDVPYSVEQIDAGAFHSCAGAKEITIPEKVTSIGDEAFFNCTGVEKINLNAENLSAGSYVFGSVGSSGSGTQLVVGKKVKKIPDNMFLTSEERGVTKLTSVVFPEKGRLETIGRRAFQQTAIQSIHIPAYVKLVSPLAIAGCDQLETITVDENNAKYHSEGNCLIETESKTLVAGCKTSVMPTDGSIKIIGDCAFGNFSTITSLDIPHGVEIIKGRAMALCHNLDYVFIPKTVERMDDGVFYNSKMLKTVEFEENSKLPQISTELFSGCVALTDVNIPEGVTLIGEKAFFDCGSLTTINIPEGTKEIGYQAFFQCYKLNNFSIPDGITRIHNGAFANTAYYDNQSNYEDGVLYIGKHLIVVKSTTIEDLTIKDGTLTIADASCYGRSTIKSVTIPNSVINLGFNAFEKCSGLTSINIPDSVTWIGGATFRDCTALANVEIGSGVKSIGKYAFYGCTALERISIPNNVDTIDTTAFELCNNLRNIYVPWREGKVPGAPWGALNATIHYNSEV